MKKHLFSLFTSALTGALLAALALRPQAGMEAARAACRQWATGVLPALFPYLVLSRLLLGVAGGGALTVPLAMLAGSPAGARLLALGGPSRASQRRAALCATASPLFLLGTLSGGALMLAAHWIGALAAYGFAACFPVRAENAASSASPPAAALPEILADSALAMLPVCGCMVFFSVVTALVEALFPLPPALGAALAAFLEMAGGCARISALALPSRLTRALLCAAVSFGGLSVFMQNAAYLRRAGADLRIQFAAKVVHAVVAFGVCWQGEPFFR